MLDGRDWFLIIFTIVLSIFGLPCMLDMEDRSPFTQKKTYRNKDNKRVLCKVIREGYVEGKEGHLVTYVIIGETEERHATHRDFARDWFDANSLYV